MGEDKINRKDQKRGVLGVVAQKIHPHQRRMKRAVFQIPHDLRIQCEVPIVVTEGIIFECEKSGPRQEDDEADSQGDAVAEVEVAEKRNFFSRIFFQGSGLFGDGKMKTPGAPTVINRRRTSGRPRISKLFFLN